MEETLATGDGDSCVHEKRLSELVIQSILYIQSMGKTIHCLMRFES